jgi:hypothetical protein
MNQFTIIEDCSPYYIRFTHSGINELIEYCKKCAPELQKRFTHYALPPSEASEVLKLTPISKLMPLQHNRVSLFMSAPGMYYRAHKDGLADRFSINYTIVINDDKCVTSWYDDNDLKQYPIDTLGGRSRECIGFNPIQHKSVKSMTAQPGECILFNTEIFHDWDNTKSTNNRIVLTLRINESLRRGTYFEDAKKLIFGD